MEEVKMYIVETDGESIVVDGNNLVPYKQVSRVASFVINGKDPSNPLFIFIKKRTMLLGRTGEKIMSVHKLLTLQSTGSQQKMIINRSLKFIDKYL